MRNPVISPFFEEDAYQGKDVVHEGIRIPLKGYYPLDLLVRFSRNAQRIIKLPAQDETGIKYREMTQDDIPMLRSMWFDPSDPTFPATMGGHVGITATLQGSVIGAAVWAKQGANLFLHQLISGSEGKELQLPTLLLWQSVLAYIGQYHSLDIGVSYNPKRYQFFRNFAVETYPIILRKPFYVPVIRMSPFKGFRPLADKPKAPFDGRKEKTTFLPRGNYALYAALKHAGVGPSDKVCIIKTFDTPFVSGCVTSTIEKTGASWQLRSIDQGLPGYRQTKAVVALHEFGVPIFDDGDFEMLGIAREMGLPIIEDCAWRDDRVFDFSDYAVYSMQKMLDLNYGGFLVGAHIDDDTLWSWGCLDTTKRERLSWERYRDVGVEQRVRNWKAYDILVRQDGMTPDNRIDWAGAIVDSWIPTVYMQRFESDEVANAIVDRLEEFGIQAGRYWPEPVVYLPIHQNMTEEDVKYIFAVVRGYFNLCRDYK
jgi:hypothetical protein